MRYLLSLALCGAVLCGAVMFATPLAAEVLPKPGKADSRVRHVRTSENNVVKVRVSMLYLTTFEFGKSERIINYGLGDSESFQHERDPDKKFLFVKSLVPGARTNLIIYTDRNTYVFDLVTGGQRDSKIYRVKVDPVSGSGGRTTRTRYSPPTRGPTSGNYTEYSAAGDGAFKPIQMWDDGRNTFMRFAGNARRPAIFKTNSRGHDTSTNATQVSANVVQVEGLSKAWTLRIGDEDVCVFRGNVSKAQISRVQQDIVCTPNAKGQIICQTNKTSR